jgi:hypothetical protein
MYPMPESQSHQFAFDFVKGLKASTLGSARKTFRDAKEIASGSASLSGTVGVLVATVPLAVAFPLYFFAKGVLAHAADALREVPEPIGQPRTEPQAPTAPEATPA